MSSLLFYNVENSKNKEKPLNCACLFHKGGVKLILCGPSWDKIPSPVLASLIHMLFSFFIPLSSAQTFPPKLVLMPEVVDEVVECCSCVDVLVCNSNMKLKAPVHTVSLELDRNIMDINYQHIGVLTAMISRRSGHILLVNMSKLTCLALTLNIIVSIGYAVQAFFYCLQAEVEEYGTLVSTFWPHLHQRSCPLQAPCLLLSSVGVHLDDLANEIVRLATPIPRVTRYLLSFFPSFFFATVARGAKDSVMAEQTQ
uniref:Dehydrogenase/reductase (SDR family) member 7Cb n=1 Tax=Oncorhynchus tshawytscha TaxID=74940 RepID=A0A8C8EK62_ONCTS